jgi:acetylglutamate kinase
MALTDRVLGRINARIVARIRRWGDHASGFSGRTGGGVLIGAKYRVKGDDLGQVGFVSGFRMPPLIRAEQAGRIPVFSSVAVGRRGALYNVNADDAAAALAAKLKAAKLILMTDVPGIMDGRGHLLSTVTAAKAGALIRSGVISRGMIPKVRACLAALKGGAGKAHIIDGRLRHSLLLEIFTSSGVGTQILRR